MGICYARALFLHLSLNLSIRMAPKSRKNRICLKPFTSMGVSFVAQVLSHSLSGGIATISKLGTLETDA